MVQPCRVTVPGVTGNGSRRWQCGSEGFVLHLQPAQAVIAGAAKQFARAQTETRGSSQIPFFEFIRILLHPHRVRGFDLLVDSGLMAQFLPEILALRGCEQPPEWHPEGDVFVHTRLMLSMAAPDAALPLLLSILLHDIAKPATFTVDETGRIRFSGHDDLGAEMAQTILRRLRFSNEFISEVVEMVAYHMRFMNVQGMRTARLKRFMARPTFEQEMELHRIDCASSNGFTDNYDFLRSKAEEFSQAPIIPPPLLNGRDLLALGFPAGPKMGELLTSVQTLQLEGTLTTREEALTWVKTQL